MTVVHRPCLGCPQPVDKENKELLCFVDSTIEQVNRDANYPFYFDLESIVNATRQVCTVHLKFSLLNSAFKAIYKPDGMHYN